MLTEDNLEAKKQVGLEEGEEYVHRHVFRAANAIWGELLEWDADKATYAYTFTLDPTWNTDNLQIVGFVSGYDETNATNCAVEQAAVCSITGEDSGITEIEKTRKGDNEIVYDLMGRRIQSSTLKVQRSTQGVYIINGKKILK